MSHNALYWFLTGLINRICELMKVEAINVKPYTTYRHSQRDQLGWQFSLPSFQTHGMGCRASRLLGSNLTWEETVAGECDSDVKSAQRLWQKGLLGRKSQTQGANGSTATRWRKRRNTLTAATKCYYVHSFTSTPVGFLSDLFMHFCVHVKDFTCCNWNCWQSAATVLCQGK